MNIISIKVEISNAQKALDFMITCACSVAEKIIIHQKNLNPDFFKLKFGLAGEIVQKVSNYILKLAINIDLHKYQSQCLQDYISESNRVGRVSFVENEAEAQKVPLKTR